MKNNERKSFEEFVESVAKELRKELPGLIIKKVVSDKVNNTKKTGIVISEPGSNISPIVYLEKAYERYLEYPYIDLFIEEILHFYKSTKEREDFEKIKFENYDAVKNRIAYKLISYKKNKQMLENVPYIQFLDLAIVFYILLENTPQGMATMSVKSEHLKMWNISETELYNQANINITRLLPVKFMDMRQTIREIFDSEDKKIEEDFENNNNEIMYILTNTEKNYGAASMIYPHILEMVGEIIHEDFYVLPSSVHEVIIVPKSKKIDEKEMNAMIVEINATQLEPEDVLSDHAYLYSIKRNKLEMIE